MLYTILSFQGLFIIIMVIYMQKHRHREKELLNEQKRMQEEQDITQMAYDSLALYIKEIDKANMDIRTLLHDNKNILSMLHLDAQKAVFFKKKDESVYTDREGDSEEVKEMKRELRHVYATCEHMIAYVEKEIDKDARRLEKETTLAVELSSIVPYNMRGFLQAKLQQAKDSNIKIRFAVSQEIEDINISLYNFARVIGIIMDNAIEECQVIGEDAAIFAGVRMEGSVVVITVKNSCRPLLQRIQDLSNQGVSTKGAGRGMGLSNLREIVNQHDHIQLDTTVDDGQFIQEIRIDSTT